MLGILSVSPILLAALFCFHLDCWKKLLLSPSTEEEDFVLDYDDDKGGDDDIWQAQITVAARYDDFLLVTDFAD